MDYLINGILCAGCLKTVIFSLWCIVVLKIYSTCKCVGNYLKLYKHQIKSQRYFYTLVA